MKILKKIQNGKDWKEFKYLWKKTEEGNPFIFLYSIFVSILSVIILTILPAFFFLFFLFLPTALLSGMETGLLSNILLGLILPLTIPQWFYIFNEVDSQYKKIAEGYNGKDNR